MPSTITEYVDKLVPYFDTLEKELDQTYWAMGLDPAQFHRYIESDSAVTFNFSTERTTWGSELETLCSILRHYSKVLLQEPQNSSAPEPEQDKVPTVRGINITRAQAIALNEAIGEKDSKKAIKVINCLSVDKEWYEKYLIVGRELGCQIEEFINERRIAFSVYSELKILIAYARQLIPMMKEYDTWMGVLTSVIKGRAEAILLIAKQMSAILFQLSKVPVSGIKHKESYFFYAALLRFLQAIDKERSLYKLIVKIPVPTGTEDDISEEIRDYMWGIVKELGKSDYPKGLMTNIRALNELRAVEKRDQPLSKMSLAEKRRILDRDFNNPDSNLNRALLEINNDLDKLPPNIIVIFSINNQDWDFLCNEGIRERIIEAQKTRFENVKKAYEHSIASHPSEASTPALEAAVTPS